MWPSLCFKVYTLVKDCRKSSCRIIVCVLLCTLKLARTYRSCLCTFRLHHLKYYVESPNNVHTYFQSACSHCTIGQWFYQRSMEYVKSKADVEQLVCMWTTCLAVDELNKNRPVQIWERVTMSGEDRYKIKKDTLYLMCLICSWCFCNIVFRTIKHNYNLKRVDLLTGQNFFKVVDVVNL